MINQVKLTIINHDGHQISITKTPIEIETYKGGSMLDDLYTHIQEEMKFHTANSHRKTKQ